MGSATVFPVMSSVQANELSCSCILLSGLHFIPSGANEPRMAFAVTRTGELESSKTVRKNAWYLALGLRCRQNR
jgi:hypothetical protein